LKKLWHQLRAWQYATLESVIFGTAHRYYKNVVIEAVSPALKDYLISQYYVNEEHITIVAANIPASISAVKRQQWRSAVRAYLNISENTHIYCYNGSGKAWQCPEESVVLFKQELEKNQNNFF